MGSVVAVRSNLFTLSPVKHPDTDENYFISFITPGFLLFPVNPKLKVKIIEFLQ